MWARVLHANRNRSFICLLSTYVSQKRFAYANVSLLYPIIIWLPKWSIGHLNPFLSYLGLEPVILAHITTHNYKWILSAFELFTFPSQLNPASIRQLKTRVGVEYSRERGHRWNTSCSRNNDIDGGTVGTHLISQRSFKISLFSTVRHAPADAILLFLLSNEDRPTAYHLTHREFQKPYHWLQETTNIHSTAGKQRMAIQE